MRIQTLTTKWEIMKVNVKMETVEQRIIGIVTRKGTNKSKTNQWQKIKNLIQWKHNEKYVITENYFVFVATCEGPFEFNST